MSVEGVIQRAILDTFERMSVFAFRVQAGKVKVRGGWMHLSPPGTPDILVIVPPHGHLLGLEVKTDDGDERDSQLVWADRARGLGATVRTVRSVGEAVLAYLDVRGP